MKEPVKHSNHTRPIKYTYKKIRHAINGSGGIKLRICERLGMSRANLDHAIRRWPDLLKAIDDEKETITDAYENALHQLALKDKDVKAIIFYLRTRGRKRGYGYEPESLQVNVNKLLNELSDKIEQGGKSLDTETEED